MCFDVLRPNGQIQSYQGTDAVDIAGLVQVFDGRHEVCRIEGRVVAVVLFVTR
jgi:hypothetical protein